VQADDVSDNMVDANDMNDGMMKMKNVNHSRTEDKQVAVWIEETIDIGVAQKKQ
jgi:hypothetical protein